MEELRAQIDEIDAKLVELFEKRMEISHKIALYKIANDMPITNDEREKEILNENIARLKDRSFEPKLVEFFSMLFKLSKEVQNEEFKKQTKYQ